MKTRMLLTVFLMATLTFSAQTSNDDFTLPLRFMSVPGSPTI